jgi:hypothetical protein
MSDFLVALYQECLSLSMGRGSGIEFEYPC